MWEGLRLRADFSKLWAARTMSLAGSQMTTLTLPLTAVLVLRASPLEMGLLQAMQFAPFLVLSLAAGAWVDRVRRRSLLIGAECGRVVLLISVPAGLWLGVRWIQYLYAAGFLLGVLTLVFNVAFQAYLPSLVRQEELLDSNSKLEGSRSAVAVTGPGLAGALVQATSPPIALMAGAVPFVLSALSLWAIRRPEPAAASSGGTRDEVVEGLRFIRTHPVLRPVVSCAATVNVSFAVISAVFVVYVTRDLGLRPATLGLVFSAGGLGGIAGALAVRRLQRALGFGRTLGLAIGLLG